MDALRKEEFYTIQEIEALPDGKRGEIIDGQFYDMAPPTRTHQRILLSLSRKIADYIDSRKGICEVNIAPFAVYLNNDEFNYLEPDISVVCDPGKLDDKGCHGAPDWILEIVSPGSRQMDYFTKLFKYQTTEVKEYWIVDPGKRKVTVYNFAREEIEEYSFEDQIPVGIYEGFSLRVQ